MSGRRDNKGTGMTKKVAVAALMMLALGACSKGADPAPAPVASSKATTSPSTTSRSSADVEHDAIKLVQTANANLSEEQIRSAFGKICDYIDAHPNGRSILGLRSEFVRQNTFDAVTSTTLIAGAVAAKCPRHRPLLEGLG